MVTDTSLGSFYSTATVTFDDGKMYVNTFIMHSVEDRTEAAQKVHDLVHPKDATEGAKTDVFLRKYSLVRDELTGNIALVCTDENTQSHVDLGGPKVAQLKEDGFAGWEEAETTTDAGEPESA
jgi:hypothetical protein